LLGLWFTCLFPTDELRQLIQKQMKQKELLECELIKEREKLEMVRFDIITLTSPMMTRDELQQLCDEISRLRSACERLADEIDVVTARKHSEGQSNDNSRDHLLVSAPRSPVTPSRQYRPPPPIPSALRCLSLQQSPYHTRLSPLEASRPQCPPSYSEVMRESRTPITNSLPNLVANDDVSEGAWACSLCTFLNYPLLNSCEQCDMPRVQGIRIVSSSFRPLQQNNQLQGSASVATNLDNNVEATAL
jgi:hypothetical protein